MHHQWVHITVTAVSVGILAPLLIFLLRRWCCSRQNPPPVKTSATVDAATFKARMAKLHQTSLIHQLDTTDIKRRGNLSNFYVLRAGAGGFPSKPGLFDWADHPSLVTEAVEHGWSRFGFIARSPPSPTVGSSRSETEISWEVSNGSAEFVQKIKFNRTSITENDGVYGIGNDQNIGTSVIRAALPLPGPPLGNSAFPAEAYFEITVMGIDSGGDDVASVEGERTKLLKENTARLLDNNDETKGLASEECDGKQDDVLMSLGLTTDSSVLYKLPGSFHGSIGFHSNGSIFIDGLKLVFESEKHEWHKTGKVVGCGFDPRKKKVFFTIDSHLVHVINCKAEEFGTPLYPTIASNAAAVVTVNFGQTAFCYGPPNAQRTPNPCFVGPLVRSPGAAAAFEDSKELFSVTGLESRYGENNGEESDADLFEIVLDSSK